MGEVGINAMGKKMIKENGENALFPRLTLIYNGQGRYFV